LFITFSKDKPLARIEKTQQEWLDRLRVRATQNQKQVILGNEIESWEAHLLDLQIVIQTLLALVQIK
jgi:hypothetical protein